MGSKREPDLLLLRGAAPIDPAGRRANWALLGWFTRVSSARLIGYYNRQEFRQVATQVGVCTVERPESVRSPRRAAWGSVGGLSFK